jgi:AsmA-like C-terminal region
VDVSDLSVRSEAFPRPLAIKEASLRLAPRRAELRSFTGTLGSSDLRASGSLENLLGFALRDENLRGSAELSSAKFNLDEWRSGEGELNVIPVPPNIDFALEAKVGELLYDKLTMRNARGRVRVKDQRVTLENFTVNTLGGEIGVTGFYETTVPAKPTFDVGLRIQKVDIPSAFESLTTVRMLAPVARYARGNFSADLKLDGALGKDMMPLFGALTGKGSLQTSQVQIQDFPPLDRIASATKLALLNDPALRALRSQFEIREGRLHIQPFAVGLGRTTMNVSGSNGLDQTLDYNLRLSVPGSDLGAEASQALTGLMSRAAAAGINLQAAPEVALGVGLTGTVTNPSIKLDVTSGAKSAAQAAGDAVKQAAEQKVEAAVDSARLRAAAEAQRLVKEAEERAAGIRAEARTLAESVKREGYQQADSLVARSSGGLARIAANAAADRLRKEADDKSAGIVREADQRADALVAKARAQGGAPPQ